MQAAADPFIGRVGALADLRSALAQVREGRPCVVIVEGPAGIGKTTLVDHLVSTESDVRVLRGGGERWESLFPYGVADQLFRLAGSHGTAALPACPSVMSVEDAVSVGSRLLAMWTELEDAGPVVTVVDDAHWADLDSLRALLFAARRLVAERIMVVLLVRSEDVHRLPEGLTRVAAGASSSVVKVRGLDAVEVLHLLQGLGATDLSPATAALVQQHTGGNPLYIRAMVEEAPPGGLATWKTSLPAPAAFRRQVQRRLDACSTPVRRLVESAAILGGRTTLTAAAAVGHVNEPVAAFDAAVRAGLLQEGPTEVGRLTIAFPHPLVHVAVRDHLTASRRRELHFAAADVVEGEAAQLRHRMAAATGPDLTLLRDLRAFAQREASAGSWARAASALVAAAEVTASTADRESLLVEAVHAMVASGDLVRAGEKAAEITDAGAQTTRDAVLGFLAVLRGHPVEAEQRLHGAWGALQPHDDQQLRSVIAQRLALNAVGRLDAHDMVAWARLAVDLASPGEPIGVDASAILGVGLGWLGDVEQGLAVHEAALADPASPPRHFAPSGLALNMAYGWLKLATDDLPGARLQLAEAAPTAVQLGSVRVAVYAYSWLARVLYCSGWWDEATVTGLRGVTLLNETGHEWLRPLAHWAAIAVPAARGDWTTAADHVQQGSAHVDDYEIMIVAAALAAAQLAAARGDHHAVLRSLEPVRELTQRDAIDQPGFWPWPDLYGDALVSVGEIDEADRFLAPHEALAAVRKHRSSMARLGRVRARIHATRGDTSEADAEFVRARDQLSHLRMPFERALIELAHGQMLRREGRRRAAAALLHAAHDRFTALDARPYLKRSERELVACGLAPAKRHEFDATRLTPQELEVARLVASGLSNRQVAGELLVSIKTVQAHLTRVYAKVGVSSRAALAARMHQPG